MGSIEALSSAPKPKPVIKVVALCGSLRKASNNLGLIRAGTLHIYIYTLSLSQLIENDPLKVFRQIYLIS